MRPEKAYKQVHDALDYWYETKDVSKVMLCKEALTKLLYVDKKEHDKCNLEYPEYATPYDMRSPYEVTGYAYWVAEMDHISDRFNATHRLIWLLAGVENREFV